MSKDLQQDAESLEAQAAAARELANQDAIRKNFEPLEELAQEIRQRPEVKKFIDAGVANISCQEGTLSVEVPAMGFFVNIKATVEGHEYTSNSSDLAEYSTIDDPYSGSSISGGIRRYRTLKTGEEHTLEGFIARMEQRIESEVTAEKINPAVAELLNSDFGAPREVETDWMELLREQAELKIRQQRIENKIAEIKEKALPEAQAKADAAAKIAKLLGLEVPKFVPPARALFNRDVNRRIESSGDPIVVSHLIRENIDSELENFNNRQRDLGLPILDPGNE